MAESEQRSPSREKYWLEIDSDEKIERMRKKVKDLKNDVSSMRKQIFRLNKHIHGTDGELLQKMLTQQDDSGPSRREADSDEVYF